MKIPTRIAVKISRLVRGFLIEHSSEEICQNWNIIIVHTKTLVENSIHPTIPKLSQLFRASRKSVSIIMTQKIHWMCCIHFSTWLLNFHTFANEQLILFSAEYQIIDIPKSMKNTIMPNTSSSISLLSNSTVFGSLRFSIFAINFRSFVAKKWRVQ